jgi:hypothetical protein
MVVKSHIHAAMVLFSYELGFQAEHTFVDFLKD